jgi:hypothetical protein
MVNGYDFVAFDFANSSAIEVANRLNEPAVKGLSMLAMPSSGSLRPSAVVTVADRRDLGSTLIWMLYRTPGAALAVATAISRQSASAPPDSAGSLFPSITWQFGEDWRSEEFIAHALPLTQPIVAAMAKRAIRSRIPPPRDRNFYLPMNASTIANLSKA